jgi:hypothetical protein
MIAILKPKVSCPHLLRASMITATGKAASVVMDCRDKPGNAKGDKPLLRTPA